MAVRIDYVQGAPYVLEVDMTKAVGYIERILDDWVQFRVVLNVLGDELTYGDLLTLRTSAFRELSRRL